MSDRLSSFQLVLFGVEVYFVTPRSQNRNLD